MRMRRLLWIAAPVALALALAAEPAAAQELEGMIVSMDASFAVLDLGTTRGVAVGDAVEVWRPLKIKHPATGKMILDRLRIGTLRVTQARTNVSVARIEGEVERALSPGDIVVLPRKAGAIEPPPSPSPAAMPPTVPSASPPSVGPSAAAKPPPPPSKIPPEIDADARDLDAFYRALQGKNSAQRQKAYEQYVLEHPKSRHVEVLWAEAQALERLRAAELADTEASKKRNQPQLVSFTEPATAPAGVALQLAAEITNANSVLLHFRRAGAPTFVTAAMADAGPSYFAAAIPREAMAEGTVEYFVEATSPAGETASIAGSASSPLALKVEDPTPPDARPGTPRPERRVTASVLTDYASFNLKKANDTVWQSEAQLGIRLDDTGLRAIRSGFGVYRGRGGTLQDLDELGRSPRRVGLTYGYLEGEVAFASTFAVVGRVIVGLREDGVNGGGQGFLRFGSDRKTNLMLGGEVLGGIGMRGITQLEWNSFPRVPIVVRSEVTNQPAGISIPEPADAAPGAPTISTGGGEVGVRSIVQVGYRILPRLVIAARGSFQARTINHAGPGGGAAVMYEW